jgi:hypothetical protein
MGEAMLACLENTLSPDNVSPGGSNASVALVDLNAAPCVFPFLLSR